MNISVQNILQCSCANHMKSVGMSQTVCKEHGLMASGKDNIEMFKSLCKVLVLLSSIKTTKNKACWEKSRYSLNHIITITTNHTIGFQSIPLQPPCLGTENMHHHAEDVGRIHILYTRDGEGKETHGSKNKNKHRDSNCLSWAHTGLYWGPRWPGRTEGQLEMLVVLLLNTNSTWVERKPILQLALTSTQQTHWYFLH